MAFALPAAATAAAATATAAAATATAATATATLVAVAKSVALNVAISAVMSAFQPQVGTAGRTFEWTLDPNAPIPFAAGRVGVAGTVCHLETYGPDKMYYGFVSVLSGAGPVRSVGAFRGDDEFVAFDGNGKAISSQWAGEMWFRSRRGTQPDTALTNPPGLKSNAQLPGWTAAHKLSGKACYMLVLGENSKRSAYPTGEPKPLVTVEGLYGWDPRQDSTYPGGAGACRLNDPATWVWLDNPILWALKWSLGLWEGPIGKGAPGVDYQVGGIGARVEGIDVPAFVAAANVADANGWKVAAYPTTDDDKAQVLDSFLQAGGAIYAQRAGKISCIQRAAPRASVVSISAADTAGPLEIDTAASRIDRINTIRPRFWSEAHRWQLTAIDDVSAEAYRDEDGAVRPRGLDYNYVPLATQAAQLAALQIANTREPIAGTIPLKPHLRNIVPGTAFTISEPGFLLDGLKCLCLNADYNPATGIVSVTFVSETDAKYPFALGQSSTPPAPPVLTPPTTFVSKPLPDDWNVIVRNPASTGERVPAFDVIGSVSNATATSVLVEWGPGVDGPWSQVYQGPPTAEQIPLTGVQPNTDYWIAVSHVRNQNQSERQIYGPYLAPSAVSSDTIHVDGTPAPDLVATAVNAETLALQAKAGVDDLEEVYGDTVSAAASALAADASAQNAYLHRIAAQGSADTAITQAGIATTKATEAGNASSAAQAAQVAAAASYGAALSLVRNPFFDQGKAGWNDYGLTTFYPNDGGRSNVLWTPPGVSSTIESAVFDLDPNGMRVSAGFRVGGANVQIYAGVIYYDASGAYIPGSDGTGNYPLSPGQTFSAPDSWIDRSVLIGPGAPPSPFGGTTSYPPNARKAQLILYYNYNSVPTGNAEIDYFHATSGGSEIGAGQSASAAVTSASQAAVFAGQAEDWAEASQASSITASNRAGDALTYRNESASARDGAVSARNDANTAASNAAGSAATATTQASSASSSALAASQSASIAAGVSSNALNQNCGFDDYPSSLVGHLPSTWAHWNGTADYQRVQDGTGGWAFSCVGRPGEANGIAQYTEPGTIVPGGWYVHEVEVELTVGSYIASGVYGVVTDAAVNGLVATVYYSFASTPDDAGDTSAYKAGRRTWSKLFKVDTSYVPASRFLHYAMNHWSDHSPDLSSSNRIIWYRARIRPATEQEVAQQRVLSQLGSSVTQQAQAMLDLRTGYANARFQIAATAPGGAAILSLASDTYGSVAGLLADRIHWGDSTFFDDATDTLRTTSNGVRSVLALGASFGTDGQLREWMGPDSVSFASMSRANAYFYRAHATPFLGGTGFPGSGSGGGEAKVYSSGGGSANTSARTAVGPVKIDASGSLEGGTIAAVGSAVIKVELFENNGSSSAKIGEANLVVTDNGLMQPGGGYGSDGGSYSIAGFGTKTGSVFYQLVVSQTSGPSYGAAAHSGAVSILPVT